MKKLLAIVLAFAPALLFAGEIKVYVFDKDLEIPLEGVKVSLDAKDSASAQTDENGVAVISVPDNISSGSLQAKLVGYKNAGAAFSATKKSEFRCPFPMSSKDKSLS